MINILALNAGRFILLVLFHVLVLNNIQFSGFVNPFMYVLFILLLPFETPRWVLLVSGFLLGLSIDIFSNTLGLHASATLFMAFLRPYVLGVISPRDGYETGTYPRVFYYGITWFLRYTIILVFAHHLFLFYLEVFRFSEFFRTLLRIILSSSFSVLFIVLSQYIVFRK
jgi:rod shape-determining protein MreD